MENNPRVAMVVNDMFFASKIRGTADAAGSVVRPIKSREQLEEALQSGAVDILLFDLNFHDFGCLETIHSIKSRPEGRDVKIIGFLPHVEVDLKRQAEMAGCDYVLPRSRFTHLLPQIVSGDLSALSHK